MTLAEAFAYFMPGSPPPEGQRWEWTGTVDEKGYGTLRHGGRNHLAHRVAYELFIGPIPGDLIIRHKNDTPIDVNPNNLEIGTLEENVQDRVIRGRTFRGRRSEAARAQSARGSRHGLAKLSENDVRAIRRLYAAGGCSQQRLARSFGVSQLNISMIVRGKTWTHVDDEKVEAVV